MSESQNILLEHIDNLTAISKAKGFLGREFINWLWYFADTQAGAVHMRSRKTSSEYEVQIWVDDRMVFETFAGKPLVHSMRGGDPGKSLEAVAAFQSGKTLKEIKLGLHVAGIGDFSAQLHCDGLKSEGLSPRSLILPKSEAGSDAEATLIRRLQHTELFLDILDGLFAKFMDDRSTDAWQDKVMVKFKKWMQSKRANEILRDNGRSLAN